MGTIRYTTKPGAVYNVTITLHRVVGETEILVGTQEKTAPYQTGEFLDIPVGKYKLRFIDSSLVCSETYDINPCSTCPDGFSYSGFGCEKIETDVPTLRLPLHTIASKSFTSYTNRGTLIFSSFNHDGTGTFERIDPSNAYWINPYVPGASYGGPMNRSAVWTTAAAVNNQDIGFSFCVDLSTSKTYYVGVGCDNYSWIKLNGVEILRQNVQAIENMLGADLRQQPFKYWYIYPIYMEAGHNIIEVYGHNVESVAAVGIEIYNASPERLKLVTSDADLGPDLIFRAKSKVGQFLSQTYSFTDGLRGYQCRPGFALNTCEGEYFCERKIVIDCGQPIADVNEKIETVVPNCLSLTFPDLASNTLTKQYIADNYFVPAIPVANIENIEVTLIGKDPNASIKYNGTEIVMNQVIDFTQASSIEFYTNSYKETDTLSAIGFKINLVGESLLTQEVLYTVISQPCTDILPKEVMVSLDIVKGGQYNYALEQPITYNPGTVVTFTNPTTPVAEYHYMWITLPSWHTFKVLDVLDNDITNSFIFMKYETRANGIQNSMFRYSQSFGSKDPVTFKLLINND